MEGGQPGGAGRGQAFWADIVHMMAARPWALASVGTARGLAAGARDAARELAGAGEDAREFGEALAEYYGQLARTWAGAQRKVSAKAPEVPADGEQAEAYRRIWVDIFDNDFTELFDSEEFGANYGRLVSKELDVAARWGRAADAALRAAGLPGRAEMDEVYRELHALRRRVAALEAAGAGGGGRGAA